MKNKFLIPIVFFAFFISACTKEGEGGSASIEGKVMVRLIKETTLDTLTTYEAQDERVYIVYGDNSTYNDDIRTSYDGNFKFQYLYKGDYKIYVYSECVFLVDSCPNETNAVIKEVEISKVNETINLGEIVINKYIN